MDRVLNTNDEVKGKFEVQYQKEIQELKRDIPRKFSCLRRTLLKSMRRKMST